MHLLFWYMLTLKSPRIYNYFGSASCLSKFAFIISIKLLLLEGLEVIPTISANLVLGKRTSTNIASNTSTVSVPITSD